MLAKYLRIGYPDVPGLSTAWNDSGLTAVSNGVALLEQVKTGVGHNQFVCCKTRTCKWCWHERTNELAGPAMLQRDATAPSLPSPPPPSYSARP